MGTLASLAANVAVGGSDIIGKALAGWPALSMLAAVKLLFSMIDHSGVDQRPVRDDQRPSADRPAVPGTDRDGAAPSGTVPTRRTDDGGPSATDTADRPAARTPGVAIDICAVAHLIPAARAARAALAREGRSLSRDGLADAMRDDGYGVSNARAGILVKILKAGENATPFDPVTSVTGTDSDDDGSDVAA